MGAVAYGVNLKPFVDVEAARTKLAEAKVARTSAGERLEAVAKRIREFEERTDVAAPMGLQREYTAAVKAWNKANGDVSRADAALKIAIAKAKKK